MKTRDHRNIYRIVICIFTILTFSSFCIEEQNYTYTSTADSFQYQGRRYQIFYLEKGLEKQGISKIVARTAWICFPSHSRAYDEGCRVGVSFSLDHDEQSVISNNTKEDKLVVDSDRFVFLDDGGGLHIGPRYSYEEYSREGSKHLVRLLKETLEQRQKLKE